MVEDIIISANAFVGLLYKAPSHIASERWRSENFLLK
jgi:hypothetical protein